MIGKTLGHYRIVEKVGAGGMGEVYRATDSHLGRDVAIKLLPESFARDAERLARFEREAHVLASLNHPNIAAIYGLEEADGVRFLVLELVPGATLAEKLLSGPLSAEEALGLARQVAEALEAAHERGIIHRDLKPANIKITPEGKVKMLDFGLAKVFEPDSAAADLSKSPTATYRTAGEGFILGTAAYMSPEQARGRPVDKRTDIWSFGCLLYEALTGQQAFSGETVSDTIAKILERDPDWRALPASTPANIQVLLRRCLQKDLNRRFRDISYARMEIDEAMSAPAVATLPTGTAITRPRLAGWRQAIPWGLAVLLAVGTGLLIWQLLRARRSVPPAVKRFVISLAPSEPLAGEFSPAASPSVALSPDGTRLVYVGRRGTTPLLYLRALDKLEPTPLPGTEGVEGPHGPFFSPDGQWVGFAADLKLKKVPLAGGPPVVLCYSGLHYGATWSTDDTIFFAPQAYSGLWRVSASGGTPQMVTSPDSKRGERSHRLPETLPGGKAILFTVHTGGTFDEARIAVLTLKTGQWKPLIEGGSNPRYVPTGHIVYARSGALLAVPFDLDRLEVSGPPVPVLEGVITSATGGHAQFSISAEGSLVYIPGSPALTERTLVWVDRKGAERRLTETRRPYEDLSLSPDGTRLALTIEGPAWNVWVYDITRGTLTRLTFEENNRDPIWTPDGKRVTFGSFRGGQHGVFWKPADGSAPEEQLMSYGRDESIWATSWSPDSKALAFCQRDPSTGRDLWLFPLEGDRKSQPFLRAPLDQCVPMFSPDGRWLAYESNETGRSEIYVQPFPGPGGKWQISTEGGVRPVWARNGQELFYRNDDKLMVASITTEPSFSAGKPRLVFEGRYWHAGLDYDIAPDGQHFVMIKESTEQMAPTQINVVLNWFEELKRRVPAGKK